MQLGASAIVNAIKVQRDGIDIAKQLAQTTDISAHSLLWINTLFLLMSKRMTGKV